MADKWCYTNVMAESLLTSPSTIIVFGQALAGLGHLRVTDAVYHGLPKGTKAAILGSQDKGLKVFHSFVSIHPVTRAIFEWAQYGWREDVFTAIYRAWLRSHTQLLEEQLLTILAQHPEHPKTILAIATHMGLAQQFAAIKESFSKRHNVQMIVVAVVTDDAPLKIWAAGGADLIFVPSKRTKHILEQYHARQRALPPSRYVVAPYMVHPGLDKALPKEAYESRREQLKPSAKAQINIAIPISGAAVQMDFFETYMAGLERLNAAHFYIVSKDMPSTTEFLSRVRVKANVTLFSSPSDREVVDMYELLYRKYTISLELTKPSEQAFKALVDPTKRGGSLLLFTDPVGRQEWDNLNFLERHGLIPPHAGSKMHWEFRDGRVAPDREWVEDARRWRGLRLPSDPVQAANFTLWCLQHGIFASMVNFSGYRRDPELGSNGVKIFWKTMEGYLEADSFGA